MRTGTLVSVKTALSVVLLVTTAPACLTLASQTDALQTRVVTLEHAEADRRRLLHDAEAQVQALTAQLDQARAQTRNLADLGARLDGIEEQLRQLHGAIDETQRSVTTTVSTLGADQTAQRQEIATRLAAIEHRITEVERRVGLAPAVDPAQIPNAPADIITQARQALTNRDFIRARALASALLQRSPQDALADDARLVIARSHVAENHNATAVQEYQQLLNDFPSGDTVPDALSEMAEALVRLGLCVPAQRTLRILIERHAQTPQGQAARHRLEEVRHLPRATCTG